MATATDEILSALTRSHELLAAAVSPLSAAQVAGPAYPTEWSIAQVLSHLGSGAEIFSLAVASVLTGSPAPERDDFMAIWDVWNAKSPVDQATDGLAANAAFLDQVRATTADQRADFRIQLFNRELDLTGVLRMRLGEHAVHSWDVLVALDPAATLAPEATSLLVDGLPPTAASGSKPSATERVIAVQTTEPERSLGLRIGPEGAELTDHTPDAPDATLRLPAEALVRLIYGRLDPDHTPALAADGVDLTELRRVFPGF